MEANAYGIKKSGAHDAVYSWEMCGCQWPGGEKQTLRGRERYKRVHAVSKAAN